MSEPTLTHATVRRGADKVHLTWTVDGDLPRRGHWLLSTTLVGGPEGPIHQFGVKMVDNRWASVFVFDHATTDGLEQRNYSVLPDRMGSTWRVSFPLGDLEVADAGRWHAGLDVNGATRGRVDGLLD